MRTLVQSIALLLPIMYDSRLSSEKINLKFEHLITRRGRTDKKHVQ